MQIVTIDFETYYDKDYSLSKMTTEAYVRDPRFEVIGVGVKVNDHPTDWFSGTMEDIGKFLRSLDYSKRAILCHHTAFDGAILAWHFGIQPKLWMDTLSMARPRHNVLVGGSLKALAEHYAIGKKGTEVVNALGKRRADFTGPELNAYAGYCVNDVELTWRLFNILKQKFPPAEMMVIDQTIRMFTNPLIELDKDLLAQHLADLQTEKQRLLAATGLTGFGQDSLKEVLMSNPKFARILQVLGVDPPRKISPTTGKETWAFAKSDAGMKELLDHPSSTVQAVVSARLGHKSTIAETRTASLIEVAGRGRLPVMLNYYGAHTGRFSGGDKLNLQNFPKKGALRSALTAPAGYNLIACDLAQIEARIVAWLAQQDDLVTAFREKRDVYSEFASEVYGYPVNKQDHKTERFVGKVATLGLGYSMGANKFMDTLASGAAGDVVKLTLQEAQNIVSVYRNKNFKIQQLWSYCGRVLQDMIQGGSGYIREPLLAYSCDGIRLPNGLKIHYPALRSTSNGFDYVSNSRDYRKLKHSPEDVTRTNIYGGKVVENIVQALARIVLTEQMVTLGARYPVVFQVHDEIVFCVKEDDTEEACRVIEDCMSTPPTWAPDLPVACELHWGHNYGECK